MTKQDAIKWLRFDIEMMKFDPTTGEEAYLDGDAENVIKAQEMAIEALKYKADEEQFWSEQYQDIDDYPDTDGDAIRYLDGLRSEITDTGSYEYEYLTMAINALKSFENDTETKSYSKDTISRQAAIDLVRDVCDAIMSGCESWYDPETEDEVYEDIREVDAILKCNKEIRIALRSMPSAQPERKTGHWILDRSGAYCCSKCMEPCATYAMMKPRDKFCKMCGSRNEVME